MEIKKIDKWTYYLGKGYEDLEYEPFVGKWLIFTTQERAQEICEKAVKEKAVVEAKHSDDEKAVCCFYLVEDDTKGHEKFIEFCLANNYLPKNKNGSYTNIAFKLDLETGMNGAGFMTSPSTHLADFIDLKTGKWTDKFKEKKKELNAEKKISKLVAKYLDTWEGNRWANGCLPMIKGDTINHELIRKTMEEKGITAEYLAEKLDATPASVKSWIKGKSRPYAWNAMGMCVYLGLKPEDVIISKQ